jgi:uncharacterized protein YjbI with pentapeptide repeats
LRRKKPHRTTSSPANGGWLQKHGGSSFRAIEASSNLLAIVTVLVAGIAYLASAHQRDEQFRASAWLLINTAQGNPGNGGRKQALEDLNSRHCLLWKLFCSGRVDLSSVDVQEADLTGLRLLGAQLYSANFKNAELHGADFGGAILNGAILRCADLTQANLQSASLRSADASSCLSGKRANFIGADLRHTDLDEAELFGARITPKQVRSARNWQLACYDGDLRRKLDLPQSALCKRLYEDLQRQLGRSLKRH